MKPYTELLILTAVAILGILLVKSIDEPVECKLEGRTEDGQCLEEVFYPDING